VVADADALLVHHGGRGRGACARSRARSLPAGARAGAAARATRSRARPPRPRPACRAPTRIAGNVLFSEISKERTWFGDIKSFNCSTKQLNKLLHCQQGAGRTGGHARREAGAAPGRGVGAAADALGMQRADACMAWWSPERPVCAPLCVCYHVQHLGAAVCVLKAVVCVIRCMQHTMHGVFVCVQM